MVKKTPHTTHAPKPAEQRIYFNLLSLETTKHQLQSLKIRDYATGSGFLKQNIKNHRVSAQRKYLRCTPKKCI